MFLRLIFALCCLLNLLNLQAQQLPFPIWFGLVEDATDTLPLVGAKVEALRSDTLGLISVLVTDEKGGFAVLAMEEEVFFIKISALGYRDTLLNLENRREPFLGRIGLQPITQELPDMIVYGRLVLVETRGDTVEYNAEALKLAPDATLEDLLQRLSGINVGADGQVVAQGERVVQVTVDGKQFFGNDAVAALKNLPAHMISKVQVFKEQNEISQLSGSDDGQGKKTINVVTKAEKNHGYFGRVFGGYGTGERYEAGGNLNFYQGKRRFSIIGQSNNLNNSSFSSQDLESMGLSPFGMIEFNPDGSPNFTTSALGQDITTMSGQQGISHTQAAGLHFQDQWGKTFDVQFTYGIQNQDQRQDNRLNRIFLFAEEANQWYEQAEISRQRSQTHRLQTVLEWNPNSNDRLRLRLDARLPWRNLQTSLRANTFGDAEFSRLLNSMENDKAHTRSELGGGAVLDYTKKFKKAGRGLSLKGLYNQVESQQNGHMMANNQFFGRGENLRQGLANEQSQRAYTSVVTYTEPLDKAGKNILGLVYSAQYQIESQEQASQVIENNAQRTSLILPLSSFFDNLRFTQTFQINQRFRVDSLGKLGIKRINFGYGLKGQHSQIQGEQVFPRPSKVSQTFFLVLPSAYVNFGTQSKVNYRLNYNSSAVLPSFGQLQPLLNNFNPLQQTLGNPNLVPAVRHSVYAGVFKSNDLKGQMLSISGSAIWVTQNIGADVFLSPSDTLLFGYLALPAGAQLSQFNNLGAGSNGDLSLSWQEKIKNSQWDYNLSFYASYNQNPGRFNGQDFKSWAYRGRLELQLNYRWERYLNIESRLGLGGLRAQSSLQPQIINYNLQPNANLVLKSQPYKQLYLRSETRWENNSNLGPRLKTGFVRWNASLEYGFFKDDALKIGFFAFDLLNQNQMLGRNFASNYIEDFNYLVLNRYFLLNLSWNLRHFDKPKPSQPNFSY